MLTLSGRSGSTLGYALDVTDGPGRLEVVYDGLVLLDTGLVSSARSGTVTVPKGSSGQVQVIFVPGDAATRWRYSASVGPRTDTGSLRIALLDGGDWSAPDAQGRQSHTGAVSLAFGDGPALVRVDGATVTVRAGRVSVSAGAVVTSLITPLAAPLFTGAFDIDPATGLVSNMAAAHPTFLAGLALTVTGAQLAADRIGLAYSVPLVGSLAGIGPSASTPLSATSLIVSAAGVSFGSGNAVGPYGTGSVSFLGLFPASLSGLSVASDPGGDAVLVTGMLAAAAPVRMGATTVTLDFTTPGSHLAITSVDGTPALGLAGTLAGTAVWTVSPYAGIDGVRLSVDPAGGTVAGTGLARLRLGKSTLLSAQAALDFTTSPSWQVSRVVLHDSYATGVEIGATPLFITAVDGRLDNVAPASTAAVAYAGTMGFSLGPADLGFTPLRFTAAVPYSGATALSLAATGEIGVFPDTGTVLGTFTGSVVGDWNGPLFQAGLTVSMFGGALKGTLSGTIGDGTAELYGTATLAVPTALTLFGTSHRISSWLGAGQTIGGVSTRFHWQAGVSGADDYVAASWLTTLAGRSYRVGLRVGFDGSVTFIGANTVPDTAADVVGTVVDSPAYTVDAGTPLLILDTTYANAAASPVLNVIGPDGSVIAAPGFAAAGILAVPSLTRPGERALAVRNPDAGTWRLEIANPGDTGAASFSGATQPLVPTLALAAPVARGGGTYAYRWSTANASDATTIAFYATTHAGLFDGVRISPTMFAAAGGTFTWDGSPVAPGKYYVYGLLSGDPVAPVETFAAGAAVAVNDTVDLVLAATGSVATVAAGGLVTLAIKLTNKGRQTARGTAVTLSLPGGFTPYAGAVGDADSASVPFGNLAAGATRTATVILHADDAALAGAYSIGVAAVTRSTNLDTTATSLAVLPITLTDPAPAQLVPAHTAGGQTAAPGGTITYELDLGNTGAGAATSYAVIDTVGGGDVVSAMLLSGSSDTMATVTVDAARDTVTLSGASLAAGGVDRVLVTVRPWGAGPVTATALAEAAGLVATPANGDHDVVGQGTAKAAVSADVAVALASSNPHAAVGGTVTFTVTLTDAGPGAASGLSLAIRLPAWLTLTGSAATQGAYDPASGTWTVGRVPAGSARTLMLTARAVQDAAATISAALLTVDQVDANPANAIAALWQIAGTPPGTDPLFDADHYLAHNPDVAATGEDPYQHYLSVGWTQGRDPSAVFGTSDYLARYPDVRAAGLNPLLHFESSGWREHRNPDALFDTSYYLARNPDVAASGIDPFVHYLSSGWKEGRDPSLLFSTKGYLAANPDVARAGADPLEHYLAYGRAEHRAVPLPGYDGDPAQADLLVDAAFLDRQLGATLIPAGAAGQAQAAETYHATGWKAGLNPDAWFDTSYYLAQNPDVKAAGIDPLLHYETSGWREGRDPSLLFDTGSYLAANPDVAAARFDPLLHFIRSGAAEGRTARLAGYDGNRAAADPLVDAAYYDRQLGATLLPAGPDAAAQAAASYHASGWRQGLNPDAWFDTAYYLSHNADVKAAGIDPLRHFEGSGWTEGRDPSAQFSVRKYLAAYPDVKASGIDPLQHYLQSGQAEGRAIFHT